MKQPISDSNPYDEYEAAEARHLAASTVRRFLWTLSQRSMLIFRRRILVDDPPTQAAVGAEFGISGERVRCIENAALERLARSIGRPRLAADIKADLKEWREAA